MEQSKPQEQILGARARTPILPRRQRHCQTRSLQPAHHTYRHARKSRMREGTAHLAQSGHSTAERARATHGLVGARQCGHVFTAPQQYRQQCRPRRTYATTPLGRSRRPTVAANRHYLGRASHCSRARALLLGRQPANRNQSCRWLPPSRRSGAIRIFRCTCTGPPYDSGQRCQS